MTKASKISDESKALHKLYRDGEIDHETLEDTMTGLALLPPQETALDVYSKPNGLDPYLDAVLDKVAEFQASKPTLETEKGRKEYRSMARKVASFKTAIDAMGKEVNDNLKLVPKLVDAERKRVWDKLELLQKEIVQPVVEWEAEQQRLEDIRVAEEAAKALLIQIENDHEHGLLLNEKYDRERKEALELAEQQRKDNEARIAQEAAERATREANEAAAKAILDAQLEKERAENEKLQAEAREKQAKIDSDAREAKLKADAELATKIAADKAEADRLKAIADTEARLKREKELADAENAKRAANKANQDKINAEVLNDLELYGMDTEYATALIAAIAEGKIKHVKINYQELNMRGVNKVIIVGNVGQDPEVKYMPSGGAVTNISVATSEQWKDKNTNQPQERTEWHRIVFFNKLGEIAGEYLRKGSKIYIEGALRTRKWQGTDGADRYTTEIVASELQMLDSKPTDQQSPQPARQAQQSSQQQPQGAPYGFDDFDEPNF